MNAASVQVTESEKDFWLIDIHENVKDILCLISGLNIRKV